MQSKSYHIPLCLSSRTHDTNSIDSRNTYIVHGLEHVPTNVLDVSCGQFYRSEFSKVVAREENFNAHFIQSSQRYSEIV